jgi:hypothetical protein
MPGTMATRQCERSRKILCAEQPRQQPGPINDRFIWNCNKLCQY